MTRTAVLLSALLPLVSFAGAAAPPSFIKPYPGQKPYNDPISHDFTEVYLPVDKVLKDEIGPWLKKVEGKVLQLHYDMPEGRSLLEVYKNYEDALLKAGFEKVYSCADKAGCGENISLLPTSTPLR